MGVVAVADNEVPFLRDVGGILRRDNTKAGEKGEYHRRDQGGSAILHFDGNADSTVFQPDGIEGVGPGFTKQMFDIRYVQTRSEPATIWG